MNIKRLLITGRSCGDCGGERYWKGRIILPSSGGGRHHPEAGRVCTSLQHIVKHAKSPAKRGLVICERVEGETDARIEIPFGRVGFENIIDKTEVISDAIR